MHKSNEPFWWSLFSAGGVMSALFVPVLIVLTGLVLPFTESSRSAYPRLLSTISFWPVRIILMGVLCLSFFHCAHRIRHVAPTIGIRSSPALLYLVCYGAAFAGAVATVVALVRL
jgi:fumarate reductase subunit D